jgi:hypothetical protein
MKTRRWWAVALGGAILIVVALAARHTPPPSSPNLGVSNGTTLTVTIFVNGQRVGDFPSAGPGPSIDPATLPAMPWTVEARSPSGRVLTSMHVEPGQATTAIGLGGVVDHRGTMGRVDLSCGTLIIWAGAFAPTGGGPPPPSPGKLGDCAP